jgi:hypothetical protein
MNIRILTLVEGGFPQQFAETTLVKAREFIIKLRMQIPAFPSLPAESKDVSLGFQTIKDWCIIAQKSRKMNTKTGGVMQRRQGRPKKYSDDQLQKMQNAYEKLYRELKDSKVAWNKVKELYGCTSGNAARVACIKLKKKLQ